MNCLQALNLSLAQCQQHPSSPHVASRFSVCEIESRKATLQAALASLSAWEKWNILADLEKIAAPTLVLWGDRDRSYGWSQPQAIWHGVKDSYLAVMPGCAHNAHLEKPELFNMIVGDFLSS